jgi:D-glycero-D-manno-heptose 1,7-bisphosphate phosphatase
MILAAAEKYNIDLSSSYMVGDDMRDVKAGLAAGCISVLLTKDTKNNEITENEKSILQFSCLEEFVEWCPTI